MRFTDLGWFWQISADFGRLDQIFLWTDILYWERIFLRHNIFWQGISDTRYFWLFWEDFSLVLNFCDFDNGYFWTFVLKKKIYSKSRSFEQFLFWFGLPIQVSLHNLDSIAQEMSFNCQEVNLFSFPDLLMDTDLIPKNGAMRHSSRSCWV